MALVPGKTPDPQPGSQPHHDHYLPDEAWARVEQHAALVRQADSDWQEED